MDAVEMRLRGSLKAVWVVLPPSSSIVVMPKDVTAKAMPQSLLTFTRSKLMRKDFPVSSFSRSIQKKDLPST